MSSNFINLNDSGYGSAKSAQLHDIDKNLLVEQEQRIKCPRCGKGCNVYRYGDIKEEAPNALLGEDEGTHSSLDSSFNNAEQQPQPYTFAECTGRFCKFTFCTRCNYQPHPGAKCLVSELGTPSKIMLDGENVTSSVQQPKSNSKLNRKKSLRRLCF